MKPFEKSGSSGAMLESNTTNRRGVPIRVRKLKLTNFRNYAGLDIRMSPGITLIEGRNGHGKTNLLEAIYLMAIGRSPRSATDRQMVRVDAFKDFLTHAQVAGEVVASSGRFGLQVDLSGGAKSSNSAADRGRPQTHRVQKTFRVNGVPKRSADFIGLLKAVLFAAEDMELMSGPPTLRRRYMDILTSQLTPGYLRDAQEYQRILTQRNHLLKSIREREAKASELEFWDARWSVYAARVMDARVRAINSLDETTAPIHDELSGLDRTLSLTYSPSLEMGEYKDVGELSKTFLEEVQALLRREIAAGFCLVGPHRDDFGAELDGMEVGSYASRGQTRTVILAMKLGETQLISDKVGDQPVALLDDVMSELDAERRKRVFDRIKDYEQVIMTTAETDLRGMIGDHPVRRVSIDSGRVTSSD